MRTQKDSLRLTSSTLWKWNKFPSVPYFSPQIFTVLYFPNLCVLSCFPSLPHIIILSLSSRFFTLFSNFEYMTGCITSDFQIIPECTVLS